jgi:hypothetical protein
VFAEFFAGDMPEEKALFLKQVDGVQVDTLRELVKKCVEVFNTLPLTLEEWITIKYQLIPFDRFDWSRFDQTIRVFPIGILTLNEGVLEHLTSHECAAIWIVLDGNTIHNDFPSIFKVLEPDESDDDLDLSASDEI